jgi:hopanoid-associated phosphorylase
VRRTPLKTSSLLIVVGMTREAKVAQGRGRTCVGAARLASELAGAGGVVSFGLCGALDPALAVGDVVIADGVLFGGARHATDSAWTAALYGALPSARRGDMASGDVIVASAAAKAALRRATGAVAVDMESHAVARAAAAAGIPFAVVRVVSDGAASALPRAAQAGFKADGEPDVAAVIRALAARPWELPALIRTALDAEKAFKSLAWAATALAPPPP